MGSPSRHIAHHAAENTVAALGGRTETSLANECSKDKRPTTQHGEADGRWIERAFTSQKWLAAVTKGCFGSDYGLSSLATQPVLAVDAFNAIDSLLGQQLLQDGPRSQFEPREGCSRVINRRGRPGKSPGSPRRQRNSSTSRNRKPQPRARRH